MLSKKFPSTFQYIYRFSRTNQDIRDHLNKTYQKLNLKQSVADKKKLYSFIDKETTHSFNRKIQETYNNDQDFTEFLKQYQQKNPDLPKIVDLSQKEGDTNNYKNRQARQREIQMLEEFREKKQNQIKKDLEKGNQKEDMTHTYGLNYDDIQTKQYYDSIQMRDNIKDEFMLIIMYRGVTSKTTPLNRIITFRTLVFMGNSCGVIGYGHGKGTDFEISLEKSIFECKKNLITINVDYDINLPRKLKAQYNDVKIQIEPSKYNSGWGSPTMYAMILMCGIQHFKFNITTRNANPYLLILCFFKCVTQNKTPRQLCEEEGIKDQRRLMGMGQYFQEIRVRKGSHRYVTQKIHRP